MFERGSHAAAAPSVLGVTLAMSACDVVAVPAAPAGTATTPHAQPPLTAGPPSEAELSPGWDQAPDGPAATRDSGLSDAALGHRYTTLVVTNTSPRACIVEGVPGVGARGTWGYRFTLTVGRGTPGSRVAGPVRLVPGAEAQAPVQWTGDLAGHDAERASILVIQLAAGQAPVRVPAHITDAPTDEADLDVGMLTTMRLGPFERRT